MGTSSTTFVTNLLARVFDLRVRAFVVLLISFIVMLSVLLGVMSTIFKSIFHDLSNRYIQKSSRRVSTALFGQSNDQYSKMYDFGYYDYTFDMLDPEGVSPDTWIEYFDYEVSCCCCWVTSSSCPASAVGCSLCYFGVDDLETSKSLKRQVSLTRQKHLFLFSSNRYLTATFSTFDDRTRRL